KLSQRLISRGAAVGSSAGHDPDAARNRLTERGDRRGGDALSLLPRWLGVEHFQPPGAIAERCPARAAAVEHREKQVVERSTLGDQHMPPRLDRAPAAASQNDR